MQKGICQEIVNFAKIKGKRKNGMEIGITVEERFIIIEIIGRVDAANCGVLEEKFFEALDKNKNLLVDCKNLEYISSMGLRVFLKTLKKTPLAKMVILVKMLFLL